ncbi:MAG TPA: hypothetical protein PKU80_09790 [Candidatus Limiplasma sp.]|nr:hypothetical protein [Candidatus Limiplasma sp.]
MNIKKLSHDIAMIFLPLLLSVFIGLCLLVLVYSIPTDGIIENVFSAGKTIEAETTYPQVFPKLITSRLDNWTDSIMMLEAAHPNSGGSLEAAVKNQHNRVRGENPAESLVLQSKQETNELYTMDYSRYWHGYLVLLKPLFSFMQYTQIRVLNTVFISLLTLLMLLLLYMKHLRRIIVPFLAMVCFLTPLAVFKSMQFSSVFYIAIISSILLIVYFDRLEKKKYFRLMFLFIGILTAYFDFLTYPIITVAVPLVFFILLSKSNQWKTLIPQILLLGVYWCIGYIGMWGSKILISTWLFGNNTMAVSSENITRHLGIDAGLSLGERVSVIGRNIQVYYHWFYLLVAFVSVILSFVFAAHQRTLRMIPSSPKSFALLLVGLLPFAWMIVTAQHSYVHFWFTHRNLVVTVFAVLCIIVQSPKQESALVQPDKTTNVKEGIGV